MHKKVLIGTLKLLSLVYQNVKKKKYVDVLYHVTYICLNCFLRACVITEKAAIFLLGFLSNSVGHLYIGLIITGLISFTFLSLSVTEVIFGVVNGKLFQCVLEDNP